LEITQAALRIAKEENVKTIFNPAPGAPNLPKDIFQLCDILCLNETEASDISGLQDVHAAGKHILAKGVQTVIITLGGDGCLLVTTDGIRNISIENKVPVMDTTGAGDCFIGTLAHFLANGKPIVEAIQRANYVAGISVQRLGTQCSYPRANELPQNYFE